MKKRILAAVLLCVAIIGTVLVVRHVYNQKEAEETGRQNLMETLEQLETREIPIKVVEAEETRYYRFEPGSEIAAFVEQLEQETWECCPDQKEREIEAPSLNIRLADGNELLILKDGTVFAYDAYDLDCQKTYYTSSLSVEELSRYLQASAAETSLEEIGISAFSY